jgi:hypothetical protein
MLKDEQKSDDDNNNNNSSVLYYLCADSAATRPITDTEQCRETNIIIMPSMGEETHNSEEVNKQK